MYIDFADFDYLTFPPALDLSPSLISLCHATFADVSCLIFDTPLRYAPICLMIVGFYYLFLPTLFSLRLPPRLLPLRRRTGARRDGAYLPRAHCFSG